MPLDASAAAGGTPPALLAQAIQFRHPVQGSPAATYRIFVQQPSLDAPDGGYPLIVTPRR